MIKRLLIRRITRPHFCYYGCSLGNKREGAEGIGGTSIDKVLSEQVGGPS